jgi:hypothetical protein
MQNISQFSKIANKNILESIILFINKLYQIIYYNTI